MAVASDLNPTRKNRAGRHMRMGTNPAVVIDGDTSVEQNIFLEYDTRLDNASCHYHGTFADLN